MCTLIVRLAPGERWPLWVAANRDELLERPASGPCLWPGERFVAPRDEQALGTWLGLTARGLFVGVTNRFGAPRDPSRRSRGQLVVEALRHDGVASLHRSLGTLSAEQHNAFHLLYTDGRTAAVTWSDGSTLQQAWLSPGLHVVTERSLGGDDHSRTERVRETVRVQGEGFEPGPASLGALLRLHDEADPLAGTCVHADALGYGTRSSLVLLSAGAAWGSRLFWSEGHPCQSPLVERPDLVAQLAAVAT